MDFWYLKFAAILVFAERICGLPLACSRNGTSYGEGATVRTEEPCLLCTCRSGTLECSLRVCADHPNGLPPGCFFLHGPNECCPQLFCEEDGNFGPSGIELRTDYKFGNKLNRNDCSINGSIYAEGSAVASSQTCEYCYCVEGEVKCIKPRCLRPFEGCKTIHEGSSCCPTHYDCRNADVNIIRTQIEKFVLAGVDSSSPYESLRTFPDLVQKTEKTNIETESESVTNLIRKEEEAEEEFRASTTTEANADETTEPPEEKGEEATTPVVEDDFASFGFQTTRGEYFNEDPTEAESTEGTSSAPEASTPTEEENLEASTVRIRGKSNFSETTESPATSNHESRNESLQAADDYDSYDYGEPRLPPSLPNLVIFPFVAADAVVKEDAAVLDARDKAEIKRADSRPDFYKDYFSPPAKTEGGFVPKESFYERDYSKEDQIETPDPDRKAGVVCQNVACPPPKPEFLGDRWTSVSDIAADLKNAKPGPLEESAKPPTDFKDESQTLPKSQQTKKPVTVTYKHVVVDFYPKYLITTTRARPKIQSAENWSGGVRPTAGDGYRDPAQNIQNAIAFSNAASETVFGFVQEIISPTPPKRTRETPTWGSSSSSIAETTVESSFFDEFLNSFLSEETTSTTSATTTNIKQKYSSKIKGNAVASKPVRDGVDQKPKTGVGDRTSSTDSSSLSNALSKPEEFSKTSSFHSPAISAPAEINRKMEFAPPRRNENLFAESTERGATSHGSIAESGTDVGGGILKLAGCNIYGMMYRVGKVITELSGPCLECLCTELGVQCRPLKC